MSELQRIDKWLWATRVFKTRSIAADACKKGRVSISGRTLKPSSMIKVGDRIEVRKPPMTLSLEVLQLLNNRVGPKLVHIYQRNLTPQSEYDLWELHRITNQAGRRKGTGRPTKKERRDLEDFIQSKTAPTWFLESLDNEEEEEDWTDFWDE